MTAEKSPVADNKALYRKIRNMAFNTVTDTGFLFEIGNAAIGFSASVKAGLISLGVSTLCFAARAAGEARKLGLKLNLRDKFNNFAVRAASRAVNKVSENLGTSLVISGGALMASAGFAAAGHMDLSSARHFVESSKEAVILASFGLANTFRGVARALRNGGASQRTLDVAGITLASVGVVMAGRGLDFSALAALDPRTLADTAVKSCFAGAAGMAVYQAVRELPSRGLLQPDLLFAGGCLGNAIMSPSPRLAFANAVFCAAFVSLDALKKCGGLYEGLKAALGKRKNAPAAP